MTRAAGVRRLHRAAALAVGGGLLTATIALSTSALAANNITITAPANNAQVSGSVHITATVSFPNDRLASWKVEVAPGATSQFAVVPDSTNSKCSNPSATGSSVNIDCLWDTTKSIPDNAPSRNDSYVVRVSATDGGPFAPGDYSTQIAVVVANGVATPSGLLLNFNDGTQKLTVSWNANKEPDLTKYVLNETINGKSTAWSLTPAQAHCTSTSCNWSRQITAGGTYSYNVVAVRNAPGTTAGTVQSQPSSSKSATFADPNPTTTTTTRPPAGGGGGTTNPTDGSTNTGGRPTSGGSTGTRGESASVNGFRIVQIAGGGPGTVSSSGSASGRFVTGGSVSGLVGEGSEPDSGFSEKLPYKAGQKQDDKPESIGQAIANIPTRVLTDDSARKTAMSITAIGLLLFVFAMQVRFITRRAAQA